MAHFRVCRKQHPQGGRGWEGQWGQMGGGDGGSLSEAAREAVLTNAGQCPQSASLRSNRVTGES